MPKWYSIPSTMRMTEREYRANIQGLNVVFGAVLGFVLAGSQSLADNQFIFLLAISAGVVVNILYLGSSPYPLFYGISAVVIVAVLPWILDLMEIPPIPKLQPTLGVWVGMVAFIELMPRASEEADEEPSKDDGEDA